MAQLIWMLVISVLISNHSDMLLQCTRWVHHRLIYSKQIPRLQMQIADNYLLTLELHCLPRFLHELSPDTVPHDSCYSSRLWPANLGAARCWRKPLACWMETLVQGHSTRSSVDSWGRDPGAVPSASLPAAPWSERGWKGRLSWTLVLASRWHASYCSSLSSPPPMAPSGAESPHLCPSSRQTAPLRSLWLLICPFCLWSKGICVINLCIP